MLKVLETSNIKLPKPDKENNNLIMKYNNLNNKNNHLRYNINKKKRSLKNGKNGNNLKRRDQMILNKRLKNLMNKMINFGLILMFKNRLIGNKNITLIGFNGK